ncbi:MAG: haloacid dehalogenase [Flavobacteriaceae bacterium]|nr:haloacid dehalogenase [Flavobacteriaceae bacterium]|tara:strand:+ start:16178 stop:16945 length:768 start_codon:yes stop_codon:yes gene_type:complete
MDGTLLNDQGEVNPLFFQLFQKLKNRNITFCAASGRQYDSIVGKLNSIIDAIYIIAENGANVRFQNEDLLQIGLSHKVARTTIEKLRRLENTYIVLCTNQGAYIETTNQKFVHLFKEYYNNYHIVNNLFEVIDEVVVYKIASYHFQSSEKFIYPFLQDLKEEALLKISGQHWLDISSYESNKGKALQLLQEKLNIKKEETVVIGDYLNDLELFENTKFGFAVENAHPKIKEAANFVTADNNNQGVEKVLQKILAS